MNEQLGYLVAAYAIVWLAIAGYAGWLGAQIRRVRDDLTAIERSRQAGEEADRR